MYHRFEQEPHSWQRGVVALVLGVMLSCVAVTASAEDEFQPAYQNEGKYQMEDPDKYFAYHGDRAYYTTGKKNGFRVNENNEESTDETIGILTFLIAPATIVYMNLVGWWE